MTEVRMKLMLDASDYIAGMKRATQATRRLAKPYRSLPRRARMVARLKGSYFMSDSRLTDDGEPRRIRTYKTF